MEEIKQAFNLLFQQLDKFTPEVFTADAEKQELQRVIGGLANQALAQSKVAHSLIGPHTAEAIILLRCAYESVVVMHYLLNKPNEIDDYKNFSILVEYKDMIASDTDLPDQEEIRESARQYIVQKKLLDNDNFFNKKTYKSSFDDESILDMPEKFERSLKNYFYPFHRMRKSLNDQLPEGYKTLYEMGRITYNFGSQVAHAHWHTVEQYHVTVGEHGQTIKQTVPPILAYTGIPLVFHYSTKALDKVELTQNLFKNISPVLDQARNQLASFLKENPSETT